MPDTAEGNLYKCYPQHVCDFIDDVWQYMRANFGVIPCAIMDLSLVLYYGSTDALWSKWMLSMLRAVLVNDTGLPPPLDCVYIGDTTIIEDVCSVDDECYGSGLSNCELLRLPGLQGGDWDDYWHATANCPPLALLRWPPSP